MIKISPNVRWNLLHLQTSTFIRAMLSPLKKSNLFYTNKKYKINAITAHNETEEFVVN